MALKTTKLKYVKPVMRVYGLPFKPQLLADSFGLNDRDDYIPSNDNPFAGVTNP